MTVNPGFGGQKFIESMLPKIAKVRLMIDALNPRCELEIDGGVDDKTLPLAYKAGARVFVAGSHIYGRPEGVAAAMKGLKASVGGVA